MLTLSMAMTRLLAYSHNCIAQSAVSCHQSPNTTMHCSKTVHARLLHHIIASSLYGLTISLLRNLPFPDDWLTERFFFVTGST